MDNIFQLTREHLFTWHVRFDLVGTWVFEQNNELFGFTATREEAEKLATGQQ